MHLKGRIWLVIFPQGVCQYGKVIKGLPWGHSKTGSCVLVQSGATEDWEEELAQKEDGVVQCKVY